MAAYLGAAEPRPLPDSLLERMKATRRVVEASEEPLCVENGAWRFHYARRARCAKLLETPEALGHTEPEGRAVCRRGVLCALFR